MTAKHKKWLFGVATMFAVALLAIWVANNVDQVGDMVAPKAAWWQFWK